MDDPRLKEIYKVANQELMLPGENVKTLADLAAAVVGKENLVDFFYQPNKALNDKTPYELCKEGKSDLLELKLMDILTSAHGG
ncbi:DUF2384 domain-containing protein [Candidatus Woesearchaeota archaeon]|nr:DUF2384 domain-containing protein [Candidatus Woesearchaeota archaeon]